jgi:acylphosphatase
MDNWAALHAVVYGHVQGVFFRAFVADKAAGLSLTGYVRNLPTGEAVEVMAEGDRVKLKELLILIKTGPPQANVEKVTVEWLGFTGKYAEFRIEYS